MRVGWLVAIVALGGCTLVRPVRPLPSSIDGVTAARLLDAVAARRAARTSLRARARLKAGMAGLWTRQAVLVQRPAEVRMDVMSPFGLVLAVGTQRDLLWAYSPSEQVRFEGEASPDNLARFLGAPVSVGDLVDILMGLPPARVASRPPTLERAPDAQLAGHAAGRRRASSVSGSTPPRWSRAGRRSGVTAWWRSRSPSTSTATASPMRST